MQLETLAVLKNVLCSSTYIYIYIYEKFAIKGLQENDLAKTVFSGIPYSKRYGRKTDIK